MKGESMQALLMPARKNELGAGVDDANISLGDCRNLLKMLAPNSIDLIVTDPPYFIDGMGSGWNDARLIDCVPTP